MNDASSAIALGRLNVPKAGDVLADQLRTRIRSGELREGQSLPTERELVRQTGLSRMSVREALRILETEGLITTRPGRNGGSRVRRPAGDELTRHLELFIWGRNAGLKDLHDVREALEALAAEGAARRRTEADIKNLSDKTVALEGAVDDAEAYLSANLDWHMAVVKASHNELLISLMNVLAHVIHDATASEAFDSPEVRASTVKVHRSILAAIIEGDAQAAQRRMKSDVATARDLAASRDRATNGGTPESELEPPPATIVTTAERSKDKLHAPKRRRRANGSKSRASVV